MPDEQTQSVNLEWNQSEDEVQAVGSFKDGNQMPVGEYNFIVGKSYPIMDNNTGFQRTSSDGIPMYKLDIRVSDGDFQNYDCGQLIWAQPDANHPAYGQKWAQQHDISRGMINRIVKAVGLPAIQTLADLEGAEFRAEWKDSKNPKYKRFGYMQGKVPQHPGHEPQAPEHVHQRDIADLGQPQGQQQPAPVTSQSWN